LTLLLQRDRVRPHRQLGSKDHVATEAVGVLWTFVLFVVVLGACGGCGGGSSSSGTGTGAVSQVVDAAGGTVRKERGQIYFPLMSDSVSQAGITPLQYAHHGDNNDKNNQPGNSSGFTPQRLASQNQFFYGNDRIAAAAGPAGAGAQSLYVG
jgi:hypothetical protein